jgi:two-component system, response regulator YesN
MYKVLLVDDEPMIREGLRTIIDWEACGFAVAGDAANGRDALAKHEQLAPDLIVIDIRMPVMDGLQAIKEIRKLDSKCHFLILSGYADFSYAKQAISQGVNSYILKPIDEDELTEELSRIRGLLDKASELYKENAQDTAIRLESAIQALLLGIDQDGAVLEHELKPLPGGQRNLYQIVLIELDSQGGRDPGRSSRIKKRWMEAFEREGLGAVFSMEPYVGLLLKADVGQPVFRKELTRKLLEYAAEPIQFTAAAGKAVRAVEGLPKSFAGAAKLLQCSFHLSGQLVHTEQTVPLAELAEGRQPNLEAMADQLYYAMDVGSKTLVDKVLREAGEQVIGFDASEAYIKRSYAHMLTYALNKLCVAHPEASITNAMPLISEIYDQPRFQDMIRLIRIRLDDLVECLCNASNEPVMKQVIDFIQRNYKENLKLETLAELFMYNSGYLGKLFKQHTGETFNTYLDKVRIRRAIELLGEGKRVRHVSELVGYANVDYFHSKFKKYVGVSPSSFKGKSAGTPSDPLK